MVFSATFVVLVEKVLLFCLALLDIKCWRLLDCLVSYPPKSKNTSHGDFSRAWFSVTLNYWGENYRHLYSKKSWWCPIRSSYSYNELQKCGIDINPTKHFFKVTSIHSISIHSYLGSQKTQKIAIRNFLNFRSAISHPSTSFGLRFQTKSWRMALILLTADTTWPRISSVNFLFVFWLAAVFC